MVRFVFSVFFGSDAMPKAHFDLQFFLCAARRRISQVRSGSVRIRLGSAMEVSARASPARRGPLISRPGLHSKSSAKIKHPAFFGPPPLSFSKWPEGSFTRGELSALFPATPLNVAY